MAETVKFTILIAIAVAAAGGQYLLKVVLTSHGISTLSVQGFLRGLLTLPTQALFLVAMALYVIVFVLYTILLTNMNISRLYPMSQGLNFVAVTVVGWMILRESVTVPRLLGMGAIVLGIYLIERF